MPQKERIVTYSYPRAALIGNPSDGYHGKTIAFLFSNFRARVILKPSDFITIIPGQRDRMEYTSLRELHNDIASYGYYGGIRLLKAAFKKFYEYCTENNITLASKGFSLQYDSNIPNRLGLAGSSAIITAALKALKQFYKVKIPKPVFANLILSVENDELGIQAGLQDRVAQAYEQPVYMDFDAGYMRNRGYGQYEPLNAALLKNVYIAYRNDLSEGSEVVHSDLRSRYNRGDKEVHAAIERWKELTEKFRHALEMEQIEAANDCINQNFDLRQSVMKISMRNLQMVRVARKAGASAKFTGSGGAIIGFYKDESMYQKLKQELEQLGITIIKPKIVPHEGA